MTQPEREIQRAIRMGKAVNDPALAVLAAYRAEHTARRHEAAMRSYRRFGWIFAIAMFLILSGSALAIFGMFRDDDGVGVLDVVRIVSGLPLICFISVVPWVSRRAARRASAAAEANRALATEHPDVVQVEPESADSWFFGADSDRVTTEGPRRALQERAE